jgi:hypothetical protein
MSDPSSPGPSQGQSHDLRTSIWSEACPAVFADQAAKDLSALDPGGDIDGVARLTLRRLLLQALVRTVVVVMPMGCQYSVMAVNLRHLEPADVLTPAPTITEGLGHHRRRHRRTIAGT